MYSVRVCISLYVLDLDYDSRTISIGQWLLLMLFLTFKNTRAAWDNSVEALSKMRHVIYCSFNILDFCSHMSKVLLNTVNLTPQGERFPERICKRSSRIADLHDARMSGTSCRF